MLVDLHAALRSYPGELPLLAANDIRRGLESLDGAGDVLSEPEVARLCAAAEGLRPFMEAPGDVQPLHGDAHPGNVIATREGLAWIDFEDACLGPVECDLATMMDAGASARATGPTPTCWPAAASSARSRSRSRWSRSTTTSATSAAGTRGSARCSRR